MLFKKKEKEEDRTPQVVETLPAVPNKVLYAGLRIYKDEACSEEYERGRIVIIEPLDPDDSIHELDILPTNLEYQPGQYVKFQTDHHKMWDAAWFHNPVTNKVECAWNVAAAEFVGPLIAEKTVEANEERLRELERKLAEKFGGPKAGGRERVN